MLFPLVEYHARKGVELSVNKEGIVTRDGQLLLKKTSCLLIKLVWDLYLQQSMFFVV